MTATTIDWTTRDWPLDLVDDEPPFIGPLTEEEQFWQDEAEAAGAGADAEAMRRFEEEMYAELIGAATKLVRCYLCPLQVTPMTPKGGERLRGVVHTYTSLREDPTEVYVLTCGHTVI